MQQSAKRCSKKKICTVVT